MSRPPRDIREASPPGAADGTASGAARVFTDTEDHDFVQKRLGLTYLIFGFVVLGLYVLGALFMAAALRPAMFWSFHLSASKLLHLLASAVLFGLWLVCRGKPRPRWMLAAIDIVGLVMIMFIASVVIALAPRGVPAEMMGTFPFALVVSLRAALVPSPPRWTAFVSSLAAIPIPIGGYVCALRNTSWDESIFPRSATLVMNAGCCAAAIAGAWAISRVVYGLRSEVKSAVRLGQYTLEDKIGEGGMGAVYRARHALLRRPTAIKLLSPGHAGVADVKRFEREVQLTSKLTHPNTIAIYDFGHTRTGVFYYAMELIDGISLQQLCEQDGPQPPGRAVFILTQIAGALAEAHDVGLIHRDVKPANVLLALRGGLPDFVKVLDFGLVKEVGSLDPSLSTAEAIAGTPLYMAPESITKPKEVDARVDLYALGGVAYWLLTGRPPFEGANVVEICSHHLHTAPPPPSSRASGVPEALDALVLRCLAKDPADRPVSARRLAAELSALQEDCPWSAEQAAAWWAGRRAAEGAKELSLARTVLRTEMADS